MHSSSGQFISYPSLEKEEVTVKHILKRKIPMTIIQRNHFDFIKQRIDCVGYAPTIREISDRFGISIKAGYNHVQALVRKGWLYKDDKKSRAISIVEDFQ